MGIRNYYINYIIQFIVVVLSVLINVDYKGLRNDPGPVPLTMCSEQTSRPLSYL